jgi:cysteinyl-tRNA synthetase
MLIYNSLTKTKEEFKPLDGNTVKIYACGPTVYDFSHMGHARVYIIWDIIQRYLRFKGYDVIYARNVTDVDDKIINKAKTLGVSPEAVARKFLYEFWHDMNALNIQPPDSEPRATEYISQMIEFIEGLITKGHAYAIDGDVYFDVASLGSEYGQLSKQDFSERLVGARDQVTAQSELEKRKKNPYDFALWKGFDPNEDQGEYPRIGADIKWQYCWESPWGVGRPGWHIECSTMVKHVLGETIDMHGGGEDLLFPHHENELAQSTGLHHKPLARFWMHNSFVQVNSEKMSKSLGNFNTIRDVMQQYSADDIRLFILQNHYRNPLDFTPDSLQACKTAMQRLNRAVEFLPKIKNSNNASKELHTANIFSRHKEQIALPTEKLKQFHNDFCAAMDNDFNTAIAISLLFNLADAIGKTSDNKEKEAEAEVLLYYANLLGLTLVDNKQRMSFETAKKLMDLVLQLRASAKDKKDYASADMIRSFLTANGINVMDSKDGSTWEVGAAIASTQTTVKK